MVEVDLEVKVEVDSEVEVEVDSEVEVEVDVPECMKYWRSLVHQHPQLPLS